MPTNKDDGVKMPDDWVPTADDYRTAFWREDPHLTRKIEAAQGLGVQKILGNPEDARTAVDFQAQAMREMSALLVAKETVEKYKNMSPEALAKTLTYVAKTMDETARLLEYAAGRADSRSEVVGLSDLLQLLNPDEFERVQAIVAVATQRKTHDPASNS